MKPKNSTAGTHKGKIVAKGSLTDVDSHLYHLDAKNNNQSGKCGIISRHICSDNKKLNACISENVAIKMEVSNDDLEFESIQKCSIMDSVESNKHKTVESKNDLGQDNNEEIAECQPKKRKYISQREGFSQYKETEKLFIRLKKSKILKQHESSDRTTNNPLSATNSNSINHCRTSDSIIKQELVTEPPEKHTVKCSKTELSRRNLMSINKTESLKLEQMLLEKARKTKERQRTEDSSMEGSENNTSEIDIEPYVYEKTSKSVFETYERKEEENGHIVLKCLLCPFHSEKFKQMSLHYKFKHKETPIEEMHFCDVKGCYFKTIHQGMFKWHMRRHMLAADKITISLFPCSQCDKVFDHRKGYLIHLKHKHKDPSPAPEKTDYPCSTCNFRTTTKPNLQAHIYRCHIPDNIKPTLTCNICGYKTHYKDCFKKHLSRVHLKKDK